MRADSDEPRAAPVLSAGTSLGTPTGRRHRRYWVGDGKAHIEVRAARRPGSERFARQLEAALGRLNGVDWAQVNAVVGRVVVAFDGEAVDSSEILKTIEGVEEAHDLDEERFGSTDRTFLATSSPFIEQSLAWLPTPSASPPGSQGLCSTYRHCQKRPPRLSP